MSLVVSEQVVAPSHARFLSLLGNPLAAFGALVALLWFAVALLAPWIAPYGPLTQSAELLAAPSVQHLLGTDQLGRDVLSRLLWGARITPPLSLLLVVLSLGIGGALGGIAAFRGGWVDSVIMRAADLGLAVPKVVLAMAVVAALGPGLINAVLVLALVWWPSNARVVRGLVKTEMQSDYVSVGWLLGAPSSRSLAVDILPNIAGPVVVLAALDVGTTILLLAGLSFLGLGAQPPTAAWGAMVANGAQHFEDWWLGIPPGLAIFTLALAFNYLGEGLRDALDPKAQARTQAG